ncbi:MULTISPECIES: head GIN domain-containing protein [unclassified Treponema]|uniref:head GIN domain-containing protein n=1 Tax=unclassified Treponema TaxID=2638727 RepID=UPI0020A2A3D0|nr:MULTISPECIES: head GIN domain-containing protein [unclassified Treponema]UTC66814.1 DUF2807 domain-containing protein [Treponema sp. OMZ 789]UTC69546.1 DUF2807 domain-containing protein [Treponema sp. OMZ 790]UTC72259.1 DUF2807 domain-containing protein [Treponema sp. OMZ 791]
MKKSIAIINILCILALVSCASVKTVSGNAIIETRTFNLKDFDSITFNLPPSEAEIIQGDEYKVELSLDSNLFKFIDVSVQKHKKELTLKQIPDTNIEPTFFKISVTAPALKSLSISGITKTAVSGFHNKSLPLSLHVGGISSVTADVSASSIEADISGIGNMNLKAEAEKCSFTISGSGDMTADIHSGSIDTGIAGMGTIHLMGKTEKCSLTVSGSGKIKAFDLETEEAVCTISGLGTVEIYAKRKLEADVSGSGSIRYAGDPQHLNLHSSGLGSIQKLNKGNL